MTIDNLTAGVNAGGLTFNCDGYSILGPDPLPLGGASPTITVAGAATTATIDATIEGPGG